MNKPFKISIAVLSLLVVIIMILAYVMPTKTIVERSITINASPKSIFEQIKSFKKMQAWSPWNDYDPNMRTYYYGVDGRVGSKFVWEGNKFAGKGEQEITAINDTSLYISLKIISPNKSNNTFYFITKEDSVNQNTTLTWGFKSENPFPKNLFTYLGNFNNIVGQDFEKGLKKLKAITEQIEKDKQTPIVHLEEILFTHKKIYTLKNPKTPFDINQSLTHLLNLYPEIDSKLLLHQTSATDTNTIDSFIATYDNSVAKDTNFTTLNITKEKAVKLAHLGNYEYISSAHIAILNYLNEKAYTNSDLIIEEFAVDSTTEKNSDHWITNVYYFIK